MQQSFSRSTSSITKPEEISLSKLRASFSSVTVEEPDAKLGHRIIEITQPIMKAYLKDYKKSLVDPIVEKVAKEQKWNKNVSLMRLI